MSESNKFPDHLVEILLLLSGIALGFVFAYAYPNKEYVCDRIPPNFSHDNFSVTYSRIQETRGYEMKITYGEHEVSQYIWWDKL